MFRLQFMRLGLKATYSGVWSSKPTFQTSLPMPPVLEMGKHFAKKSHRFCKLALQTKQYRLMIGHTDEKSKIVNIHPKHWWKSQNNNQQPRTKILEIGLQDRSLSFLCICILVTTLLGAYAFWCDRCCQFGGAAFLSTLTLPKCFHCFHL